MKLHVLEKIQKRNKLPLQRHLTLLTLTICLITCIRRTHSFRGAGFANFSSALSAADTPEKCRSTLGLLFAFSPITSEITQSVCRYLSQCDTKFILGSCSSVAGKTQEVNTMTVDVYLAPASGPCRAVLMTAKYIGVDTNSKIVNLMTGDQMKPEYIKMNPQHCVPTIDDNGFYLWESRAIQTYLVNKYAPENPVYPKDPKERAVIDRMLYFDIGTLYKAESEFLYPQLFRGQPADPEKAENFKKALDLLETFLGKTPYVAGNHLTLADISIIASLSFAEIADYSFGDFPKISAWMQKLKSEIPSYKEINDEPLNQFKEFLKSKK